MNDEQIIALYWQRDQEAIARTDQKYGKYCLTIAKNILRVLEDSEECVSDTYLETWNAIPPAKPVYFKTFLGKLTRNNALNRYEYNQAKKRGSGETAVCFDELSEIISGSGSPEDKVNYDHLVTCINLFLSHLKKEQRIIFVRRYFYESSVREIAADLGISESKTKVTLSRLRGKLKEELRREGIFA